jgi:Xaa-Pro aminopeptidase
MLSLDFCRKRQERLLARMAAAQLDFAIMSSPRMVYYFSGALVESNWPQSFVLSASGASMLVTNREPAQCAAVEVRTYTGYTIQRFFDRGTMQEELQNEIAAFLGGGKKSIGAEFEAAPIGLAPGLWRSATNIAPWLAEMRRPKDPDEIDCIRATIALTEAGYAAARNRCEPGMSEYQAYSIIQDAMVAAAETAVDLKGDFACGTRAINGGGPPTSRLIERGDLYILDLFPIHRGYMCDLCRTFCMGTATSAQKEVWAHVLEAHEVARRLIRPGLPALAVYEQIRTHLERMPLTRGSFTHHAGHGVGMEGWERPWLNAGSDQVFVEGEVIACEPGLYSDSLRGGIRLEHNYLVTADGPVALDTFPMEL